MLKFFQKSSSVKYIVVFLGNPGAKYNGTRHNVGFMTGDKCEKDIGASITRMRFKALCGECTINGEKVLLMKPQTFMNLSGEAVAQAVETGRLGGLGVDVYTAEPFGEQHPFRRLLGRDNVCLTPHMAWGSAEARQRCLGVICENIRACFGGERLNRIV